MIIALFALSLVMILGGIAAVVQGFPYVRLESGLAMVIGGSTAASAGAVLLGIAVAVMQMKMLAAALGRGVGRVQPDAVEEAHPRSFSREPVVAQEPSIEDAAPATTTKQPGASGIVSLARTRLGSSTEKAATPKTEPDFGSPPPHLSAVPVDEPPLPHLLPPETPQPASAASESPDEGLFAETPEPAPEPPQETRDPAQEELALRPSLPEPEQAHTEEKPAAEPEPPAAEEPKPAKEELQVVGTYSSGANTYVMFSNGTIEAETPQGRFNFASLEELKKFVDSGGEAPTRGAA